jgi:hypothetical protein
MVCGMNRLKNPERLPALAKALEEALTDKRLDTLKFLLKVCDGQHTGYDLEAISRNMDLAFAPNTLTGAITQANGLCADYEIEPPLLVSEKKEGRQSTSTGKAVLYLLTTEHMTAPDSLNCVALENYIIGGELRETTLFTQDVCSEVLRHLRARHQDDNDPLVLSQQAIIRFTRTESNSYSNSHTIQSTVSVTDAENHNTKHSETDDQTPRDERNEQEVEVYSLEDFMNEHPENAGLLAKIQEYILSFGETLEEDEWLQIKQNPEVFKAFIMQIYEMCDIDSQSFVRLKFVGQDCGVKKLPIKEDLVAHKKASRHGQRSRGATHTL